jgi:predicted phosphodiesterase
MNEPVRVLSDLHLGHKVSRIAQVSALRPLIAGAGTIVFNGDTWQELARKFYGRSQEMLADLRELCREEGAEPIFLAGNHDPSWPGPEWLELAGGRIVVTHGDALLRASSPWKREILISDAKVSAIWDRHPTAATDLRERFQVAREIAHDLCSVEYPIGRSLVQRAWDAATPPRRALKMIEAWIGQGAAGAEFCERYFPQAEVLLIGHFHWAGCWLRKGRRILNTGSFTPPGRALWAEWSDGFLSYGRVAETPGKCAKGATLAVWRM